MKEPMIGTTIIFCDPFQPQMPLMADPIAYKQPEVPSLLLRQSHDRNAFFRHALEQLDAGVRTVDAICQKANTLGFLTDNNRRFDRGSTKQALKRTRERGYAYEKGRAAFEATLTAGPNSQSDGNISVGGQEVHITPGSTRKRKSPNRIGARNFPPYNVMVRLFELHRTSLVNFREITTSLRSAGYTTYTGCLWQPSIFCTEFHNWEENSSKWVSTRYSETK